MRASSSNACESIEIGNARGAHVPVDRWPVGVGQRDDLAARGQVGEPAHDADEVRRVARALEADEVRAEQALEHLARATAAARRAPAGGNGMWWKNPMRRSGRSSRSICGDQLELVVVHPDGRALRGLVGGGLARSAG